MLIPHFNSCPALCQEFSEDPAGRAGALVKRCSHKGPGGHWFSQSHVCSCGAAAVWVRLKEAIEAELEFHSHIHMIEEHRTVALNLAKAFYDIQQLTYTKNAEDRD